MKATFHRHLSGTRNCDLPSSGTSDGLVTSSPRRRCRRKRRFIVTFPALATVISRPQAPLTALSPHPPQKVPTKATFHRHLSGTRNCDLPSSGTSDGLVTSTPRRRCRRKRHFIVTFLHSRPWYPSSGTSDGMSPYPPAEGADESIVSSSPFLHSRPWYPSSGTSDGHVTSSPRRRCRLKRRFIVTFPALAAVVSRPQAPLTALSPQPPAEGAD